MTATTARKDPTIGHAPRVASQQLHGRGSTSLRAALLFVLTLCVSIATMQWVLVYDAHYFYGWLVARYTAVGLAYVGVGVWLWSRRPANRTGALMAVAGALVLASAAANLPSRWFGLLGLLAAEAPIAALTHLVLAFPSGVLRDRTSRGLVILVYASSIVWQIPIALFGPETAVFPVFHIDGHTVLAALADNAQSIVGGAVLVGAVLVLVRRWRSTHPLAERRVLGIVFAYGTFALASFPISAQVLRRLLHWSVFTLLDVQLVILIGIPIVFTAAVLSGALARTVEIAELAAWLASHPSQRPALRDALADALGDPSVQLLHELPETPGYVDSGGNRVTFPPGGSTRGTVMVDGLTGRAVIVYDAELIPDPAPVDAAGRVIGLAIDHERVTVQLIASQAALRESRLRILEYGDQQRRQLARDLHDGLQGRLVLAAIHAGHLATKPDAIAAEQLRDELSAAIDELRRLVHGVLPPLLLERGLFAAVEDLVDRIPLHARVEIADDPTALPWPVAAGAYFIVAEALANTVKHAHATDVHVALHHVDRVLHIRVQDNGIGGAQPGGSGLQGVADRVSTLAGLLRLDSPSGAGTTLTVELPCAW